MKILSTLNYGFQRLKLFIYGPSGSGKTYLARTIPAGRGIIISAEAGLLVLAGIAIAVLDMTLDDDGKVIPKEKRMARLAEFFKYLNTEEAIQKYDWVMIDSLTEISQNILEALALEFPDRKEALPMWGEYNKRMRSMIKSFRDLPHYHVVMLALSTVEKDENARMIHTVDVNGKISSQMPQYFDEVFFIQLIEDGKGGMKSVLHTKDTGKTFGKDRSGKLAPIEDGNLSKIFDKIQGKNAAAAPAVAQEKVAPATEKGK